MEVLAEPLVFALNGKRVELTHVEPTMTLLTYLRTQTELKGTKLGCGEGGCGACVVFLSRYDTATRKVEGFTINSCLALLCSIKDCAVTTIEGLGNSRTGLHAVQKRFAGFHASQCGFCTPGMCMSVYGALKQRQNHKNCTSDLKAVDMERSVTGNICRCTGYRPIVDVCKSFGGDVEIEDLGLNTFWKHNKKDANVDLLPGYDPSKDPQFPEFLIQEIEQRIGSKHFSALNSTILEEKWVHPTSIQQVFLGLESFRDRQHEVKLVVGNTSAGIYKNWNHKVFISLSKVPELLVVEQSRDGVEIGAGVSISKLIGVLERWVAEHDEEAGEVYRSIATHLKKLASSHVRNAGSIGGNLVMAQKFEFDSDLATVLLGVGSTVKLVSAGGKKEVVQSMDEFLQGSLDSSSSQTLLKSVFIPSYYGIRKRHSSAGIIEFKTYRSSPRPLGNAVAYVNAAFLVHLSNPSEAVHKVDDARLAFGAFGHKHAVRATQVEEFLKGKVVTHEVILEAIELLKPLIPSTRRKSSYRRALAVSFFFKFFSPFISHSHAGNGTLSYELEQCQSLILGRQKLPEDQRYALGQPSEKIMAELQASGEAVYVDDIPSPPNCLHAAFVYSNKALARVKGIHMENAMASPGAVSFFSVKDIPANGANVGIKSDLTNEKLFAEDTVECVGQAVGVMVADTSRNAKAAAGKVEVDYDTESLGPPVLTIEDAVSRGSFYPMIPAILDSMQTSFGNVSEGFSKADHKIEAEVQMPTQYYFYMETNTVLVVPDEDNCLTVYSSCQSPEVVQTSISACLGIPMHNIRVITRRVGGGFGGKAAKACIVAAACAVAAFKLQRPVRMYLDRNTDMIMMGGREAVKAVYSAGFTSDGTVTALKAQIFVQAGWSPDMSWLIPSLILSSLKKVNWGSFEVEFKVCRTNVPSRTAMRAPGEVEGSFIADAIMEHVAAIVSLDSHKVIERNMHSLETAEAFYDLAVGGSTGFTLPMVWEKLKQTAEFASRLESIHKFNSSNLWSKRGLAMAQCSYSVVVYPKPARVSIFSDNSVVVEVGGVEIGQGLWTKVRQAAAYTLSELFREEERGIPITRIRVVQADSISVINGGWTAGSTSSEASCEAVRLACNILVERLMPIKLSLQKDGQNQQQVSWESLVTAAKLGNVDLSAQAYFVSTPEALQYLIYGAGASEVEIDVLTGETKLLRTDMVYDCGKSLNPAVDIGQIEGAFAQGIGFFMTEEYVIDEHGRLVSDGTWTYKPPTVDTFPRNLNIELFNSPAHQKRVLSSKASGEPPLLLASSVHSAIRHAIAAARKDVGTEKEPFFELDAPASIDRVRTLCGLDNVEQYLRSQIGHKSWAPAVKNTYNLKIE